jgi:carboxylesterase
VALGEAFHLGGDGALGAICVHGFTGTPYEMRFLGERLADAGIAVHGVRLPGHGTRVEDLEATTWADWAGAVEDAFDALRARCDQVAIVGQSLGGLLGLYVASRRPEVAGVGSLATPLWLEGLSGRVARWAAEGLFPRIRTVPKLHGSDVRDRRVARENPSYRAVPLRALGELARFMAVVDAVLPAISQPVLVLHGAHDHTAPVACAARIAERVGARVLEPGGRAAGVVRTRILPRSYHLIAADIERDIVAAEVIAFLRRHVTPAVHTGDLACAT